MKHSLPIAIVLISLSGLSLARSAEETPSRASIKMAAAAIETELEGHGERVMGKELYHWNTRLEKIEDCRAELSIHLTTITANSTIHVETVNFSLGALDPYDIQIQEHYLQLPCAAGEPCIFSTSTCSRKSPDGIVIDCTTANQKRVDVFAVQFDGDADSGQRLQLAFRQAAEACRQPTQVTF